MATIIKRPNGRKAIQITCSDGSRKTLSLGKIDMPGARDAKHFIEALASRTWSGLSPTAPQCDWLNSLSDAMHQRIANAGLVSPRVVLDLSASPESPTLGEFTKSYIEGRSDVKDSTREQYGYTRRLLLEHFGTDRELLSITRLDAKNWQRWMRSYVWKPATETTPAQTLAEATISKHSKRARTMFEEAVDARLIDENPMAAIKGGTEVNRDRDFFVEPATANKILESINNPVYRLAFALARYGGFRQCEILNVTWSDIIWSENKIHNDSPKTGLRFVPIFPELRPYLDSAFDAAPDGQVRCMGHLAKSTNLGVQTNRFVEQAGVKPWRKLYQNMRASRRTELEEIYPSHVCDAWLGHSTRVAKQSYLQVTPAHWEAATSSAANALRTVAD